MKKSSSGTDVRRHSFVLRVFQDEKGRFFGHLVEPLRDWRTSFGSHEELWQVLKEQLELPATSSPPDLAGNPDKQKDV